MANHTESKKRPFRFSLRTLLLFTTIVAVFTAMLFDRSGQILLFVLLVSVLLWLLTMAVLRGLERGKISRAITLVLLAVFLVALFYSLFSAVQ
jgi:hypothetical protein